MNIRKHAFALIFGSLLAIVAGGIGFLLFTSRAEYQEVKDKLVQAEERYNSLTNAKPFPSAENVEIVEKNAGEVSQFYKDLLGSLCENQPAREDVTPAQFADRLQDTFADLRLAATNETVSLKGKSKEFYFGFEQYTGVLPDRDDIPRLLGQLRMVESLCKLLFENKVSSLVTVGRDVFEDPRNIASRMAMQPGPGGGLGIEDGGALGGDGSDLYSVEEVELIFTARDGQVWSVLDALGSSPQFSVVTSIMLRNLASEQVRRNPSARPAGIRPRSRGADMEMMGGFEEDMFFSPRPSRRTRPSSRPSTQEEKENQLSLDVHEERIMAGRDEMVEVTLQLDIYRFCPEDPEAEEEEDVDLEFEG